MIELIPRRTGMNITKTGRKGMTGGITRPPTMTGRITPPPAPKKAISIDMKGAVQAAFAFAKDMYPEAKDLRLEEVEPSPSSDGWSVVLSFSTGQSNTFAIMRGEEGPRAYKKITIDSKSGKAQSLKVWK
jgi:hypothetical protein